MALPVSVLMALLMLCSIPTCRLACVLRPSHGHQETFTLLNQMEKVSILSCLKDRTDFQFPQVLMDGNQFEKTHATAVLHELLQQIFNLFSTSDSLATWDESLLDKFLIGLHQHLEDLETCLEKERKVEETPLGSENSRLAVKRYFQGISVYLKEKQYSSCAWEVVRVEIRKCFLFINKLKGNLRK
ncbi:interferon alpha-2-like [Choloepus didactylus]|uniref:interferon alpha-2-like n=1 Tax=Choloepus didactylus TaxID=27675 RepID=UPI00189D2A8B|nr:interferon alpha-2-like [Choloepus didactylus]XP_037654215.1 interferon alpha-2-like [Choloepus didactylus]